MCYGEINVDGIEKSYDGPYDDVVADTDYKAGMEIIRAIVEKAGFSLSGYGDIILSERPGENIKKDFETMITTIYTSMKEAGYTDEFTMYGKIIIDYVDYYDATDILVLATDGGEITVFPPDVK